MNIEQLKAALSASPENVPLLMILVEAHEDLFELSEAKDVIKKVLTLEPENIDAKLKVIQLTEMEGNSSEAILRLEVFLEEHPNHALGHLLHAKILIEEGDAQKAYQAYQKAVKIDHAVADNNLQQQIIDAGGGFPKKVLADGSVLEEDDYDLDGMDAMKAHDLGVEFQAVSDKDFSSVGGMQEVKEDIQMKIIFPLENPDLYAAYGKKAGGGVLMYGPPGCGKTLMSRATAGEIKSGFFSIGLHQIFDMYIGQSEKNLNQVFELCRSNKPAVLFFDEIDALAADRKDFKTSSSRTVINQFLAEMDGSQSDNEGVLILGATNAPWHVDSAFLRPGRFDRVVFVPPPDFQARVDIIKIMAEGKPLSNFSPEDLAKKTEGFSGADLSAIFDQAIEQSLKEAMKSKGKLVPVTGKMLLNVAKKVKPSTKKWFESAKNYALYANQGGLYDDILDYLKIKK